MQLSSTSLTPLSTIAAAVNIQASSNSNVSEPNYGSGSTS